MFSGRCLELESKRKRGLVEVASGDFADGHSPLIVVLAAPQAALQMSSFPVSFSPNTSTNLARILHFACLPSTAGNYKLLVYVRTYILGIEASTMLHMLETNAHVRCKLRCCQ